MAAKFNNDPAKGAKPSCCEVRQFIKWDKVAEKANSGPPHKGFPSSTKADTWIEDRNLNDTQRYGHRSGPFSALSDDCFDRYTSGTTRDDANGDTYCGADSPDGPKRLMKGKYQFRLDAVDTCNGNAVKASSSVITLDWT